MNNINQRLSDIEKKMYSDVWAVVAYTDGRTERKRLLDVINYCMDKNSAPRVTDISLSVIHLIKAFCPNLPNT